MTENKTEYNAEAACGKLKLRKDKTHWHAFDASGKQVGQPFMELSALLESLDAILEGGQRPVAVDEPTKEKLVEEKLGEAENKSKEKFTITFDKHHFRAYPKGSLTPAAAPYMRLNDLLAIIGATAYVGQDPAVSRAATPERANGVVPPDPKIAEMEALRKAVDEAKAALEKASGKEAKSAAEKALKEAAAALKAFEQEAQQEHKK